MAEVLRVSSLNVRGIAEFKKRQKVTSILEKLNSDIILIQETHLETFREWKGKSFFNFLTSRSAGVAILFKPNFSGVIDNFFSNSDGRISYVDFSFENKQIRVICVYAPNIPADRKIFFSTTLPPFFSSSKMNIIAGDMNCVNSIHYDTLGHTSGEVMVGSSELESLATSFGCSDPYRRPPGALKTILPGFREVLRQPADSTNCVFPKIVPLLLNLSFFHFLTMRSYTVLSSLIRAEDRGLQITTPRF